MKTKEEKLTIEKKILQEIELTKISIIELRELTKPIAPDCAIGRVSRMDAINNKSINEQALRKAESKLRGLNAMIQNIDNHDFGLCAKCKNEIPLGRILLMPHSRFCVHCAN